MSRQKCCRCDNTNLIMAYNDYDGNFEKGWCEECWDNKLLDFYSGCEIERYIVIEEQKMEESSSK